MYPGARNEIPSRTKLAQAALIYGRRIEKANKTQLMKDRISFVHAENALGRAAQAYYNAIQKERRALEKLRHKG